MYDRFGSVRPIPHTRRRMAAISAYRTTGIDVPLPSGCAPSWAKCDLPRSPGLHANARSLCCFLEREGLFDRQLQRAGGREMHEVADRAGISARRGPLPSLAAQNPLMVACLKMRSPGSMIIGWLAIAPKVMNRPPSASMCSNCPLSSPPTESSAATIGAPPSSPLRASASRIRPSISRCRSRAQRVRQRPRGGARY